MTDIAEKKYMNKKDECAIYGNFLLKFKEETLLLFFSTKYPKKSQLSKDLVEKEDSMID